MNLYIEILIRDFPEPVAICLSLFITEIYLLEVP
jgi:hypothetical protein